MIKIQRIILFVILFVIFLLPSQSVLAREEHFDSDANGRIIISMNFDHSKKNVAIIPESWFSHEYILFQQVLAQELMANGYSVIERLQFDRILRELSLDQTGAVKQKDQTSAETAAKDTAGREVSRRDLTKNDLKKLGEILGISYMIFYGLTDDYCAYIRIVNLETAEVVLSAVFSGNNTAREKITDQVLIASLMKAITASKNMTVFANAKDIYINFSVAATIKNSYSKLLDSIPASKILYKEDHGDSKFVVYVK